MTNRTNRCNKLSCSKITHEGIGMDGNMISTWLINGDCPELKPKLKPFSAARIRTDKRLCGRTKYY